MRVESKNQSFVKGGELTVGLDAGVKEPSSVPKQEQQEVRKSSLRMSLDPQENIIASESSSCSSLVDIQKEDEAGSEESYVDVGRPYLAKSDKDDLDENQFLTSDHPKPLLEGGKTKAVPFLLFDAGESTSFANAEGEMTTRAGRYDSAGKIGAINPTNIGNNSPETKVHAKPSSSGRGGKMQSFFSSFDVVLQATLADRVSSLHFIMYHLLNNGKRAALLFGGGYLVFLVIFWFPLYLWSCLVGEIGVTAFFVALVYTIGQYVVRWLVFPGSTYKIQQDIAEEFSKYSLRVLENGIQIAMELSSQMQKTPSSPIPIASRSARNNNSSNIYKALEISWPRMAKYRDRIFAVYANSLRTVHGEEGGDDETSSSTTSSSANSTIPLYGNNPIRGDVRVFPYSKSLAITNQLQCTVSPLSTVAHNILEDLRLILHTLDELERGYINTTGQFQKSSSFAEAPVTKSMHALGVDLSKHCVSLRSKLASIKSSVTAADKDGTEEGKESGAERSEALLERSGSRVSSSISDGSSKSTGSKFRQGLTKIKEVLCLILDPYLEQSKEANVEEVSSADIFNMNILRATLLSRYKGARQFWVPNSFSGGYVDCVVIPPLTAPSSASNLNESPPKAVLYCNPNAGLYEVAAGMNLMGGNVSKNVTSGNVKTSTSLRSNNIHEEELKDPSNNWTDFYLRQGYHVVLYNYSGYGRSHGGVGLSQLSVCRGRNPSAQAVFASHAKVRRRNRVIYQPVDEESSDHVAFGTEDRDEGESPRSAESNFWRDWIERSTWRRILYWFFFGFKPTPSSLKSDALCVASFIENSLQIESIVIHGESIGGMAAASAARELTARSGKGEESDTTLHSKVRLLVCDRTFCNLEATAQHLVGAWSGYAIRALTMWNTDVAADFQASQCPKVVATDAADIIIADVSSLKSGLAMSDELFEGKNTRFLGWVVDTPRSYRLADWDGSSVMSMSWRCMSQTFVNAPPCPVWPADKRISLREATHFGWCVRRIAKVASYTSRRKEKSDDLALYAEEGGGDDAQSHQSESWMEQMASQLSEDNEEEDDDSIELQMKKDYSIPDKLLDSQTCQNPILMEVWKTLCLCDGFCGLPLGVAAKNSTDSVVSWLCAAVVYGSQVVAAAAETRCAENKKAIGGSTHLELQALDEDFSRHLQPIIEQSFLKGVEAPRPLNKVVSRISELSKGFPDATAPIKHELLYCICMLNYVKLRISSAHVLNDALQSYHCRPRSGAVAPGSIRFAASGSFFRLQCGHNNHFSVPEKVYLASVLEKQHSIEGLRGST